MSHRDDDLVLAVLGVCAGPVIFWHGFRSLRLKRLIDAIATSKVRSMAMGTVELCGTIDANGEDILQDPIFGKDSVGYRIRVEEYRSSGKSGHWETIHSEDTTGRFFWLVDDTGRVLVNPKGADCHYKVDLSYEPGLLTAANPEADAYLARVARSSMWGRSRRLTARILRPGDPFYVLGCAVPVGQSPPWHRRAAAAVKTTLQEAVRRLIGDPVRMKELDKDKDGRVCEAEWDAGVARLRQELEKSAPAAPQEEPGAGQEHVAPAVVRATPEGLLVLADESESELANELGLDASLSIWGGPVIAVGSLAYLCFRLGILGL